MTHAETALRGPLGGTLGGFSYGVLGLPLAFVALPLYVVLPNHYASQFGVPLALLGTVLLLARLLDAVADPLIGRWVDALFARGMGRDVAVQLESGSRDTLQNLRNARHVLGGAVRERVTLLSSRYHLARCALLARQLGFDAELCAAEAVLPLHPRSLGRLAAEAAYVCWVDVGTRWARLIGNERMLARVT